MRYVSMVLGAFMVLFAAVQYNDPDPYVWVPIYLVSAAWAFAAAFRRRWFGARPVQVLLAATVVAYIGLTVYYWPQAPGFWHQEVWWQDEEAREGMGMMIALAALLFSCGTALKARNPGS